MTATIQWILFIVRRLPQSLSDSVLDLVQWLQREATCQGAFYACGTMGHVPIFAVTGLLTCRLYCLCLACFLPAHGWTGESTGGGGHLYPMIRHSARI